MAKFSLSFVDEEVAETHSTCQQLALLVRTWFQLDEWSAPFSKQKKPMPIKNQAKTMTCVCATVLSTRLKSPPFAYIAFRTVRWQLHRIRPHFLILFFSPVFFDGYELKTLLQLLAFCCGNCCKGVFTFSRFHNKSNSKNNNNENNNHKRLTQCAIFD